jgi:hypothetical protein
MRKVTIEQGKLIADLINQVDVAEIMLSSELAWKQADPAAYRARWRNNGRKAEAALQGLGIPVSNSSIFKE